METTDRFQQQLSSANEDYRFLLARGRSSHIPLAEYSAAHERVLKAERALAAARGDQYAVPLDLGFSPEAAVSAPVVIQNDYCTVLTFNAVTILPDGARGKAGTAIVEFDLCSWTSFGYPNDEALAGHPLYGRGLAAYGVFEVHNSHWVRRMTEQNKVSFPNTEDSDERHFVFSFHDSTFECISRGIKTSSLSTAPYENTFSEISRKILAGHDS
jgi:hypothetical protein